MTNTHSKPALKPVPENINFAKTEEEIIRLWKELDAFRTQDKLREDRPKWSFYDGPPFATGLPHYGHILASTIKDTVCRDAVMNNFYVERRWGWDCHGLPIEYEIDKKFGISGPDAVAKMGIANYNKACRDIVMTYADQWESTITRLGRWIDFENDYKTMYPYFMESVWWVFKQIFDKGLVYKGFKVMPYSTKCCTPLSNFEAGQNYAEVVDPAVVVNFPLVDDPDTALVAWTTTPWTLPMNLATCVHPDLEYVKVLDKAKGKKYIMMEQRTSELFKTPEDFEILEKYTGKQLEGTKYQPLFEYFGHFRERGAFKVVCDTYVTTDAGTGIVHQAPYCGEDDFRVCLREGIISKDGEVVCPLTATGHYNEKVTDFAGMYVKDADKDIMKHLTKAGRMVKQGQVKHNYPFCWRSDTPLLYMAVPSWFIRVEDHREALCKSNAATYWVPNHVKEKRFHNWLSNARDWSISRNRYWGTPIPIWQSEDGEEVICIGSVEELAKLSGVEVTDLHRENIDHITIPSARPGKPPLKRISEVFDCWFESGSMPYGQAHYPFNQKTKKQFEDTFPANFIAEGVDQTRGWFYSLTVIGTLLYGQCPFKNLIVNGLVLAKDGTKMSKRKKNYTDPTLMINNYGADALRLYLINSPVVRAEDLRFKDDGVRDICKDVFLPWFNAYRFLIQNVHLYQQKTGKQFELTPDLLNNVSNFMDRWVLSELGSLVDFVKEEMRALRLYTVVPRLVEFFTVLTNWYVRLNRARLRGEENDAEYALATLTNVLYVLSRRMAPCTPFLSEHIFQGLRPIISDEVLGSGNTQSVHFMLVPDSKECGVIDEDVLRAMRALQNVVDLARVARERKVLPVRQPLQELVVVHEDPQILADIQQLAGYIKSELNVKVLTTSNDKSAYNVKRCAMPDQVKLGRRLKKAAKPLYALIRQLTEAQIEQYCANGTLEVGGHTVGEGEINVQYSTGESSGGKFEPNSNGAYLVLLDTQPNAELIREGTSRDIINRIQQAKKAAKLVPTDKVTIVFEDLSKQQELMSVANDYHSMIQGQVRSDLVFGKDGIKDPEIFSQDGEIAKLGSKVGMKMKVRIFGKVKLQSDVPLVMVDDTTVLLENPKGNKLVTSSDELASLVSKMNNSNIKNSLPSLNLEANSIYAIVKNALVESNSTPTPAKIIKVHASGKEFYILSSNAGSNIDSASKLQAACESLVVSPDRRRGATQVFTDKSKKTPVSEKNFHGLSAVYC